MQESHWKERHISESRADPYEESVDSFQNVSLEIILSQQIIKQRVFQITLGL